MILADGARYDLFRDLLQRGELPHIEKELMLQGGLTKGVTTFPSTTGPAYFPFLTGCFPGILNVPGIRWFDKAAYANPKKKMVKFRSYVGIETFLINRDMKPVPTLFDLLPQSYNIFNSVCRGAGRRNLTKIMRIWYWYYAHLTDRWEFLDQQALKKSLKALDFDFDFLFVVFPGIDEYSHLAHPLHDKTIQAYHFLDAAVGELVAKLKQLKKWEGTLFWIVSDHGLSKTDTHFCVNSFLEQRGLAPFYYPKVFHRRHKKVANMMSGNGMTHLYFKGERGWGDVSTRAEIEQIDRRLLEDLVAEPAVDLLCVRREKKGIDILSKRGEAFLYPVGDDFHYTVKTRDPFGYPSIGTKLDREESLKKTIDSDYPDALSQLTQLFESTRSGDVVLSATPGFDLRLKHEIPEHKGSHGSLHREHMLVPIVTNAVLSDNVCRTADVFPTTLQLLGEPIPSSIDGASLL